MKSRYPLLIATCIAMQPAFAEPVVEKEDWQQQFVVGDHASLKIDNIWGDVTIAAGAPGRITMSISSERRADDQQYFDRSKALIPLLIEHTGGNVTVRVGKEYNQWTQEQRCDGCRLNVDFVVNVPVDADIDVRTVNDGDVAVSDVAGLVSAGNINGSIRASGLHQCEKIESINGNVTADFAQDPAQDCRIATLNGDIALLLPDATNVDFDVDLGNGKMRSDVDLSTRSTSATVEKRQHKGRNHYDIEQLAGLRIGRGGHTLTLKSLNGDVMLARSEK